MKKLIFLLLILIITPFLITSEKTLIEQVHEIESLNKKNDELKNWAYIKNRLFDGETAVFKKLEGPILIECGENTSKADSLLIEEVLADIRKIIPNKKIDFFNDYIGISFSEMVQKGYKNKDSVKDFTVEEIYESRINLSFEPSYLYKNTNNDFIQLCCGYSIQSSPNIRLNNKIISDSNVLVAMGNIFSKKQKKNYLKAGILRELVFIQRDSYVKGRSIFAKKEITGLDYFILDRDIFLLQKLYSDNFLNQFEDYLYSNYPWRYAYPFLNKAKMRILATSIVTLIGILVFILLFSFFQNREFKYRYFNYLFPLTLIILFSINLNWIYSDLTTFNTYVGWISILIGWLTGLFFSLIISTLLFLFESIFINKNTHFTVQLSLKIFFTFIALHLPTLLGIFFFGGIESLFNTKFINIYFPWFVLTVLLALGRGLLIYLNHFSENLVKEKDVELSKLKEVNAQSELKLLQSHINPHFLYNALNSIASLAHNRPDKTEKMALSLSNLFRYSINKKGQKMSTIKEEVLMVENYLDIEKIRFGKRLKFTLHVDKNIENEKLPMYILQPLVENAIKHGISEIRGEGFITLEIKKNADNLLISVSDNGPSFPKSLISGHGLQTVYDLLRLSYGENATLRWENSPEKKISILISKV